MVARSDKGGHLMAPGIGMLGPAMTEHDRVSGMLSTRFKDFQFNTVDWNKGRLGKIVCGQQGISFYGFGAQLHVQQACSSGAAALHGHRLETNGAKSWH